MAGPGALDENPSGRSGFTRVFLRRVGLLVGGTASAQVIALSVAPILTRLYTPATFGLLAIMFSIATILLTIATGRYEVAIPLAAERKTALNLAAVALFTLVLFTGITSLLLLLFRAPIARWLNIPALGVLLWAIPVSMIVTGAFDTLTFAGIRTSDFRSLFVSKVTLASSQGATQILLAPVVPWGLIAGDVTGRGISMIVLACRMARRRLHLLSEISWTGMREAASEFRRFPLMYAWGTTLNFACTNVTPVLIASLFGATTAGYFALGYRVLFVPISLVGQSVAQVFYGEASRLHQERPAELPRFVASIASRFALLSLIPAIIVSVAGPQLFAFVFGSRWIESGRIARILVIVFVAQFIHNPISVLFNVLNRQGAYLLWSAGLLILSIGSLYAGSRFLPVHGALLCYSIATAVGFLSALVLMFRWTAAERNGVPEGRS